MVVDGELRYVLYGGDRGGKQDIVNWLQSSCEVVSQFSSVNSGNPLQSATQPNGPDGSGPGAQASTLYDCR